MTNPLFDQPCKNCQGAAGLSCKLCDGLGMVASFELLSKVISCDPFATADAQGMSFRAGGALPRASRELVRTGWPYRDLQGVTAKPSRWPF